MPIYAVHNIETGEPEEDFWGSYSAFQEYLNENPHLSQTVTAPAMISGVSGVTHKNDSGFNDMLSRIADANPHSPLAQTHGKKGVKESKTREAVNRERVRQAAKGL
jgi:hypothetical protein